MSQIPTGYGNHVHWRLDALNYRRLVGDCTWPPTTPFAQTAALFPAPVVTLRALKSDVVVGLDAATVSRLDASATAWRTNGMHALVQGAAIVTGHRTHEYSLLRAVRPWRSPDEAQCLPGPGRDGGSQRLSRDRHRLSLRHPHAEDRRWRAVLILPDLLTSPSPVRRLRRRRH